MIGINNQQVYDITCKVMLISTMFAIDIHKYNK